jgi:O-antigen ligase
VKHIVKSISKLFDSLRQKELWFEHLVVLLTGFWIALIPFGKGEIAPVGTLAALGLYRLIQTKGRCAATSAAKTFLTLLSLYLLPVAISMPDAVSLREPLIVLLTSLCCGLAGLAVISAAANPKMARVIALTIIAVVGLWFLDAGIQALFGRDLLGVAREGNRLSGPFLKKTQMGYYSGPFSALLLMFALHKKWKPVWLWVLFVFLSAIVLLNNSRGGWVMYAVVAAVFGYRAFIAPLRHRGLMCGALILTAVILVSGLYTTSATFKKRVDQTLLIQKGTRKKINRALSNRLAVWEAAIGIVRDHPVNGIGASNYRLLCTQYWPMDLNKRVVWSPYPHQIVLEYAVGTGAIGLLGLFVSMGLCVHWWRNASAEQRRAAAGYALTLLAIYFPLNTHRAIFSPELSVSLWMLIALYAAAIRQEPAAPETCK